MKPSVDALIKWAEGFESTRRWLERMNKRKVSGQASVNTLRSYFQPMKLFYEYAGLNPDQLVAEREEDLLKKSRFDKRRAEDRLDNWLKTLQRGERAPGSNALSYYAVCSFYKANFMPIVVDIAPKSYPVKHKPTLTKDNLSALLEAAEDCDQHKSFVFCQAQSGLSVSDLFDRSVDEVLKQFESGAERIHFHFRRIKEEAVEFDSFFGAGSTRTLKAFLETRKSHPSERLFLGTNIDSFTKNIDDVLGRLSPKAGLDWMVSSHDLRKFFSNQLKTAHPNDPSFNNDLIEYWMGHTLSRTRGAYTAPPVEEQLKLYILAEPRLDPYAIA